MEDMTGPEDVLHFWFTDIAPEAHWKKDPAFDQTIERRFGDVLRRAAAAELWTWRVTPRGRLAEIIVLDQFSRNIFRDQAGAFSQDALALALSQEAIAAGADADLQPMERSFLYMPYMHSESALIHEQAVELFSAPGLEKNFEFELKHKRIIDRFGRYPHRNAILGRKSTDEEAAFLLEPGSSF